MVETKNFSKEEASLFLNVIEVDEQWRDEISTITGRNPLLLSYFENCNTEEDYRRGYKRMELAVNRQIRDLLEMKGDVVLESTLADCEKWLMCAQYSIEISNNDRQNFDVSYVGLHM